MLGVLHGFGVIAIIIAIGYLLGRLRILSEEMARGLNNICFWIATPSLLFDTLIKADLKSVFSVHLSVAVFANAVTSLLFILISYLWLKRKPAELVIGGLAAGYVNSANLGIPIALYVIHDTTAFVPILLFQTILLCPLTLSLLDYLVLDHSEQKTWERTTAVKESYGDLWPCRSYFRSRALDTSHYCERTPTSHWPNSSPLWTPWFWTLFLRGKSDGKRHYSPT